MLDIVILILWEMEINPLFLQIMIIEMKKDIPKVCLVVGRVKICILLTSRLRPEKLTGIIT